MEKIGGTRRRNRRLRQLRRKRIETKKKNIKALPIKSKSTNKSKSSHGSKEDPQIPMKLSNDYSDTITTWIRVLDPNTNQYYYWNKHVVTKNNPNGMTMWVKPTYGKIVDNNTNKVIERMNKKLSKKTSASTNSVGCLGCI